MYTIGHDYYAILGVAKDATLEEIKGQYKRLMKEHHPDQYNGLKAKYEKSGDEALLKILGEKIKEAEEFCKLLNEAFAVLSDPLKRKQYDEQTVESKVEEPKISVSPKTVSFGALKDGEKKSSIFTIKNDGGPAASVNIDWEGTKPDWGDLIIEPDENNVFPIKVTVAVNTTGIPSGSKDEKILVTVDGKVHTVEAFIAVSEPVAVPIAKASIPTSSTATPASMLGPIKTAITVGVFVFFLCSVMSVVGYLIWGSANSTQQQKNAEATQAVVNANANASATAYAAYLPTQISIQATQNAWERAATQAVDEMKNSVKIDDVKLLTGVQVDPHWCGHYCNTYAYIQYTLTNTSSYAVHISFAGERCDRITELDGQPTGDFRDLEMKHGESLTMICDLYWDMMEPANYQIEVIDPYCLEIYPYTGVRKDC